MTRRRADDGCGDLLVGGSFPRIGSAVPCGFAGFTLPHRDCLFDDGGERA